MIILIAGAFIGGAITHIFVYIVAGDVDCADNKSWYVRIYRVFVIRLDTGYRIHSFDMVTDCRDYRIRQLHELTTGKAISVVILMIISAIILTIALAAVIAILFSFNISTNSIETVG